MSKIHRKVEKIARSLIHLPQSNKRHFSFIVDGNKILSVGWNNGWKTHPMAYKFGHRYHSIHSELAAILNINFPPAQLQDYEILNLRLNKEGGLVHARPCFHCCHLLCSFGLLRRCQYTNSKGIWVKFVYEQADAV